MWVHETLKTRDDYSSLLPTLLWPRWAFPLPFELVTTAVRLCPSSRCSRTHVLGGSGVPASTALSSSQHFPGLKFWCLVPVTSFSRQRGSGHWRPPNSCAFCLRVVKNFQPGSRRNAADCYGLHGCMFLSVKAQILLSVLWTKVSIRIEAAVFRTSQPPWKALVPPSLLCLPLLPATQASRCSASPPGQPLWLRH